MPAVRFAGRLVCGYNSIDNPNSNKYICFVNYEWNDNKNQENISKHPVSLDAIYGFEWGEVMIFDDMRKDYGERR